MDKRSIRDKDDKQHCVIGALLNYDATTTASPTYFLCCCHSKNFNFQEQNDIGCSTTEKGD
jgi:hypothetical protein